jgi:hypothetical protein
MDEQIKELNGGLPNAWPYDKTADTARVRPCTDVAALCQLTSRRLNNER